MKIAVTGRPGIGKTTLCLKVYEKLKDKFGISGFITLEVREGGRRVGFKILDLKTLRYVWLAKIGEGKVKVGKYSVFVENLESVIENIDKNADLIIVDEVGPMELKSRKFVEFMSGILKRGNLLVTVHYKSRHWLVEKIKSEFKIYVLNEENRNSIVDEIVKLYDHRR